MTRERVERITKAHACENCGEYNYRNVSVRAATKDQQKDLGITWLAKKTCGVCGAPHELGINDEGEIVYVS